MGSTLSLSGMLRWVVEEVCTSGGGHADHIEMSLTTIWRSVDAKTYLQIQRANNRFKC